MPDLAEGTEIADRYRVVSRLGSGGMADVYLADDIQLGRRVALKLLHRRFAGDPDFVERFRREAQSAAALQHPNIVSVYDRGEWDGTSYISMEYLPGRTLKELIRDDAPLDPLRAVSIAQQVAQAARFAHRGGVIHRDLKPQNVIVDGDDRAVVTDFGIARAGASGITEAGSVMGTAHYISPEQAQGGDVVPASDVYSIGVILYEMLTGRVPFDAESPVAIALKHVSEQPLPPSAVTPGIGPDIDEAVLWMLRKDPTDRPVDADALLAGLDAIAERLRVAGDTSATVAFAIPAAGSAAASSEPATAVANPPGESVEDGDPEEDQDRSGGRRGWWIAAGIAAAVAIAAAAFLVARPDTVTMPLVVGKDLQTATTIIANAGIEGSANVQRVQSSRPKDEVIRQEPLAGEQVATDREVTLVVSDGPGTTTVPSVAELSEAEARSVLVKAGFRVKVRDRADPDVRQGYAIGTDPSAGTSLPRGTEVVLLISSGAQKVAVPDVVGDPVDDARSALIAAGFVVNTTKEETDAQPDGTVLSQSPASGSEAAKGSTVSIVVAVAPPKVPVPDLIGASESQARSELTSSDLIPSVSSILPPTPGCDATSAGTIVAQTPPAGTQVARNSKVRVTLCKAAP